MTMEVLQDKFQIGQARQRLVEMEVSLIDSPLRALLRKLRLMPGMATGHIVKSWDVLSTLDFLENNVKKDEPILDIGSYASEVIVALHKLGYSNLTGIDLNPDLLKMPYRGSIRYEIGNFMHTKFEDATFQAITSISVIEHGFDGPSLLKEMSRLLQPNGYFIASFDYWPEKIDTTGISYFGMEWTIVSKEEVLDFITEAAEYGLHPVGEMMYEGKERPISCGGKQYTFAWLVLKRLV